MGSGASSALPPITYYIIFQYLSEGRTKGEHICRLMAIQMELQWIAILNSNLIPERVTTINRLTINTRGLQGAIDFLLKELFLYECPSPCYNNCE